MASEAGEVHIPCVEGGTTSKAKQAITAFWTKWGHEPVAIIVGRRTYLSLAREMRRDAKLFGVEDAQSPTAWPSSIEGVVILTDPERQNRMTPVGEPHSEALRG